MLVYFVAEIISALVASFKKELLTFCHYNMLQVLLVYFLLQFQSHSFLQGALPLFLLPENGTETWVLDVATSVSFLLGLLS